MRAWPRSWRSRRLAAPCRWSRCTSGWSLPPARKRPHEDQCRAIRRGLIRPAPVRPAPHARRDLSRAARHELPPVLAAGGLYPAWVLGRATVCLFLREQHLVVGALLNFMLPTMPQCLELLVKALAMTTDPTFDPEKKKYQHDTWEIVKTTPTESYVSESSCRICRC